MARRFVTAREQAELAGAFVREAVWEIDPDQPEVPLEPWEQELLDSVAAEQKSPESTAPPPGTKYPPGVSDPLNEKFFPGQANVWSGYSHDVQKAALKNLAANGAGGAGSEKHRHLYEHAFGDDPDNPTPHRPGQPELVKDQIAYHPDFKHWLWTHHGKTTLHDGDPAEHFADYAEHFAKRQDAPQNNDAPPGLSLDLIAKHYPDDDVSEYSHGWWIKDHPTLEDQKAAVKKHLEEFQSGGFAKYPEHAEKWKAIYEEAFGEPYKTTAEEIAKHFAPAGFQLKDQDQFFTDHVPGYKSDQTEEKPADSGHSPGFTNWLRDNEENGGWLEPTDHFQEWVNDNYPDWEPTNWESAEDLYRKYSYPFNEELPDWWSPHYSDEVYEHLSDWQSDMDPEQMHEYYNSPGHGGDAAKSDFEDYLDQYGVSYPDQLDDALADYGVEINDTWGNYAEWKDNLDSQAIGYYTDNPSQGADDFNHFQDFENGYSMFYTPSYPGAQTMVNYPSLDEPGECHIPSGVSSDILTSSGYQFAEGFLPYLLTQQPDITDLSDLENIFDSEWREAAQGWKALDYDDQQQFRDLENSKLHPNTLGKSFAKDAPAQDYHSSIVTSPDFKAWFKDANSGFDLDGPNNKDTVKQLQDSHNPWVQGKVIQYAKNLQDNGMLPDQSEAANQIGQLQNDPEFFKWYNNQSAKHKMLYAFVPQYALEHYAEKDNPPPGFTAYHAAHPEMSVLEALPEFHALDHGKLQWVNKEKALQEQPAPAPAPGSFGVQDIIDAIVDSGDGWKWYGPDSGSSSSGLVDLHKSGDDMEAVKQKLKDWSEGKGTYGKSVELAKKVYDQFFGAGAQQASGGVTLPASSNVSPNLLTPSGTLKPGVLNFIWDDYSSSSHSDGSFINWIKGWSAGDWKIINQKWGNISDDNKMYWENRDPDPKLIQQEGYVGSGQPPAVITKPTMEQLTEWGGSWMGEGALKSILNKSPEELNSDLTYVKNNPDQFNSTSSGEISKFWYTVLQHMEDQGWKPGILPGTSPSQSQPAPAASGLKHSTWGNLKLGPLPSVMVDGDDEANWALKPGLPEFLESKGYSPSSFKNLSYGEQVALGKEFKSLGQADPEDMQIPESQLNQWATKLNQVMDNKGWVTGTEDYETWRNNLSPAALKYFSENPDAAHKDFNSFLMDYEGNGSFGAGYQTLPVPALQGQDLTDEEVSPKTYPQIGVSFSTPESIKDPVTGELDPFFVKWLWGASDKTLSPDEFVYTVSKWKPQHWQAAEQAFLGSPEAQEGASSPTPAPPPASSGGQFALPDPDLVNSLAKAMNEHWSTHDSDNWNAWAHTLSDQQIQHYLDNHYTSESNNPADLDFEDFYKNEWNEGGNYSGPAGWQPLQREINDHHRSYGPRWARDVGQAYAQWKWEQNGGGIPEDLDTALGTPATPAAPVDGQALYEAMNEAVPHTWAEDFWVGEPDDVKKEKLQYWIDQNNEKGDPATAAKLQKVYDQFFGAGAQSPPAAPGITSEILDQHYPGLTEDQKASWLTLATSPIEQQKESLQDQINYSKKMLEDAQFHGQAGGGDADHWQERVDNWGKVYQAAFGKPAASAPDTSDPLDELLNDVHPTGNFTPDFWNPLAFDTGQLQDKLKKIIKPYVASNSDYAKDLAQKLEGVYQKYFGEPSGLVELEGGGAAAAPTVKPFDQETIDALLKKADPEYWDDSEFHNLDGNPEIYKSKLQKMIANGEDSIAYNGSNSAYSEEELQVYKQILADYFGVDKKGNPLPGTAAALTAGSILPFDKDNIDALLYQADPGHWGQHGQGYQNPSDYKSKLMLMISTGEKHLASSPDSETWSQEEINTYKKILADYFGVDKKGNPLPATPTAAFSPSGFYKDFKKAFPNSIMEQGDFSTPEEAKTKLEAWLANQPNDEWKQALEGLQSKYFGTGTPAAAGPPAGSQFPPGMISFPDRGEDGGPAPMDTSLPSSVRIQLSELAKKIKAEHTIYTDDDLKVIQTPDFQQWFADAPSQYRTVAREFPYIAIDDFKSGDSPGWVPQGDPGDIAQQYQLEHFHSTDEKGGEFRHPSGDTLQLPNYHYKHWPGHTINPRSTDHARPNHHLEFKPRGPDVPNQLEIPLPGGSSWEPQYQYPTVRRGIDINWNRYKPGHDDHNLLKLDGPEGARHRAAAHMLDEIKELMVGSRKVNSGYGREDPKADPDAPVQGSLFEDDKVALPDDIPDVDRRGGVDDWMELFAWGQKNNLTPEQMWAVAKKAGSDTPEKWGTAPLSYLIAQSKHHPEVMARQVGNLIGDPDYAKQFEGKGRGLDYIADKLKRVRDDNDYGVTYSQKQRQEAAVLYDKWFGQSFLNEVLAHKILDYLETGGWKPTGYASHPDEGGIGPHWTTHGRTQFGNNAPGNQGFPVTVVAEWPGTGREGYESGIGEDPDRKDAAWGHSSENEIAVNPGAPMIVKQLKMRHPFDPSGDWIDIDLKPHVRRASLELPSTPRPRGRTVLSHQERFAWEWNDDDEPPPRSEGGWPSSFDTPMWRSQDRPALGDGSHYFSPREVNPPSTSSSRPEVYRAPRTDPQDTLPDMPESYHDVPMWRGVSIDLNHPGAADIHRAIFGEHPDDEHLFAHDGREPRYDHPDLGHAILEHLENDRPRGPRDPVHGLGPHWTLNPVTAKEFAVSESLSALNEPGSLQLPVRVRGNWTGVGENPYRDGTGEAYDGQFANEDEINLLPGAPMNISEVQVRHPRTKKWVSVLDQPQQRLAAATPVPVRPRTAKRVVTQREWLEG